LSGFGSGQLTPTKHLGLRLVLCYKPMQYKLRFEKGCCRHAYRIPLLLAKDGVIAMRPFRIGGWATLLALLIAGIGRAQEEPVCVEGSSERRGQVGCSIVENRPLPGRLKEPVFWHIDQFDSAELAKANIGPSSIAFEAHGNWWLMSVGPENDEHH